MPVLIVLPDRFIISYAFIEFKFLTVIKSDDGFGKIRCSFPNISLFKIDVLTESLNPIYRDNPPLLLPRIKSSNESLFKSKIAGLE